MIHKYQKTDTPSKEYIENYFHFILAQNVKLMTLCKYPGRPIQRNSHSGTLEAWIPARHWSYY